ncbi:copper homeostasis protein CutC [Anditalea andensis]|uniref:PF03932 family protein CutC n=1 Tax=Anditalea andensis TaxID=1048983 RepID=A0A074L4Y8_9BACT|nr:copper homeostasis protein CutC [Anditalea andensis]KEO75540.1 copper homeostasis protein CutC [Anditalea andensis]
MGKIKLEAPVYSIESALKAASCGIDRLELCSNFAEGGETPSAGTLKFLKKHLNIPIYVMIRPRGGNFVHTTAEIEAMKEDISILSEMGADGFVFGILTAEGKLDVKSNSELIKTAGGKPCTLHRAFDSTRNLNEALIDAIHCGFKRILSSGGMDNVSEGLNQLLSLLAEAREDIIIMPGGGLDPSHIPYLNREGLLKEVHASCKGWRPVKAVYKKPQLSLTKSDSFLTIDRDTVSSFQSVLAQFHDPK